MTNQYYKDRMICDKRFALYWWLHERVGFSYPVIGAIFKLNHTSVLFGARKAKPEEILLLDMAGKGEEILELLNRGIADKQLSETP